ncbi:MAG: sigma-70 family RNA polymerase sigma factor [Acidimicrobiia bacterium]|nr:sigma-70 family RNA polymerase sigma factor [Acidimicrobiia bacterium]
MNEGHGERVERFRVLYDAAYPRLMGYALRRARTRDDAHDVVADTMLIAWRRLDDIPTDERRMAWMYGVARRVLANQYRSTDRRDRLTDRLEHQAPAKPGDFDVVHEALDRLRADDREILTLAAWDDLSNDEIAVVLSITPGAVAVRLHRARTKLARELARLGVGSPAEKSMKSESRSRTPEGVYGIQPGPGEVERE